MIKKILFYVAAFAVSLVFASNAYADEIDYTTKPTDLIQVSSAPVTFATNDYKTGLLDSVNNTNDIPANLKDNSLTTFVNNSKLPDTMTIEFDNPIDISGVYIASKFLLTSTNGYTSSSIGLSFKYYDEFGDEINSESIKDVKYDPVVGSINEVYRNPYASKGIKKIVIVRNVKYDVFDVYEIDIFGTESFLYKPVSNLNSVLTDTTASISWDLPKTSTLDHINFNGKDIGKSVSYLYKDLKPETEYTVKIDAVYTDGTVISANYTFKTDKAKDVLPPGEVTEFKGNPDKTFVDLSWSLPTDDDYEKLLLYRDGVLLKTLTTETSYKDEKLSEDTTYKYKIVTVDKIGNKSEGKTITVLTKFTQTNLPPEQPLGLTAKPLSKGVKLSWKNPTSGSVKGYKIYMFEKDVASNNILDKFVITAKAASTPTQVNTVLLSSTSYQVSGLENGTAYGFYIVAVNSSGLSSVPSNTVYSTPTINSVPPVNIGGGGSGSNGSNNAGFSLSDVTSGVSTWFGGIWLILAFAIGIMVSFIIANRIKKLFVA